MIRERLLVTGIVQGVGFRPFVHRLTRQYALSGFIRNTSTGVTMEIQGEEANLLAFREALLKEAPALASIEGIQVDTIKPDLTESGFHIMESSKAGDNRTLISPDIGICADCRRELLDPNDRRFRYPFINCTNCGPRFTIIQDVPYDRARTSMAPFPMCAPCQKEYEDIENRRYHAQPDCCPVCGPRLLFYDGNGREETGDPLVLAKKLLKEKKILAVKGLGGMHLACRMDDEELVKTLRARKQRDEKPFALMCRDVETARRFCELSKEEEKLLTSQRKPIVLLKKRDGKEAFSYISENEYMGVMLPYTPVHILLLEEEELSALIMTSANLSDCPIVYKNEEALDKLSGIADGFLLNNREIVTRCDDSLMAVEFQKEYPIRRSRGYVPYPLRVTGELPPVLACGAEQKASFSLGLGNHVFASQHIGDLKNWETFHNYEEQIRHFERMFSLKPELLVCDLHPDYLSTEYATLRAEEEHLPLVRAQHHHAHMASCMADNHLEGKVLGLVWDGTGLGEDGTIWGGELLYGDYRKADRLGSIRPVRLPGGDKAVKEIWRIGCSYLKDAGIPEEEWASFFVQDPAAKGLGKLPAAEGLTKDVVTEAQLLQTGRLLDAGRNAPFSSGMGRLFDGVCSILGRKEIASYEGQGAVLLEAMAEDTSRYYPVSYEETNGVYTADVRTLIQAIASDCKKGQSVLAIAGAFHNSLAHLALDECLHAVKLTGERRVVLSGGVFQNRRLLRLLVPLLEKNGLQVFLHSRVSANDEGISLGQAMIGAARNQ